MSTSDISASLIIDDFPANASYWRRAQCEAFGYEAPQVCDFSMGWPDQRSAAFISPRVYETLIELIEQYDIRGKLSVLPVPGGLGRIDQSVRCLPDEDLEQILELTRSRMADRFTICLEVLTHSMAFDVQTGGLLPHTESAWVSHLAASGRRDELAAIFEYGAAILRNVGLVCQGFVLGGMPDVSGITCGAMDVIRNEGAYLDVMAAALREGLQRLGYEGPLGIMACSSDENGGDPYVIPHPVEQSAPVYHFFPTLSEPLLKVFRGGGDIETEAGKLITADLDGGVLVEQAESGRPLNILVHAQTLNAMNTGRGVSVLRLAMERLHQRYGKRICWQTPIEQAESKQEKL